MAESAVHPQWRPTLVTKIGEILHGEFKGRTGVDLDKLAESIVATVIDPVAWREYETREGMFTAALVASMDYAIEEQRSQDAEIAHLRKRIETQDATIKDLRDSWRYRNKAAESVPT